jgi:hypothetical protein
MIAAEDGSGLSEVYEKQVTLVSPAGTDVPFLLETRIQMENTRNFQTWENNQRFNSLADRTVLSEEFENIFRQTDRISADLNDEFEIVGRVLTLLCPERKLKFDQVIVPKKTWPLPKTVKFTSVVPSRVDVTSVPSLRPVPESVVYTDDGYKLKLNFLSAGERYLLSLEYDLPTTLCLEQMVELSSSTVISGVSEVPQITCRICALLKYPDILARGGCAVTFKDVESCIGIQPGPDRVYESAPAHPFITESDLHRYIKVKRDFTFGRAEWICTKPDQTGGISQSRGIRIFIRTDLSTGKPAADGILSFQYSDLFL